MPSAIEPKTEWGKNLRAWRKEADLTQDQVAAKSGIGQTVISAIENGRVATPEIATWNKLCDFFGKPKLAPQTHEISAHFGSGKQQEIPVFAFVAAGDTSSSHFTDQGYVVGDGMYTIGLPPGMNFRYAMALEIRGDSMEPKYQSKQIVIADTTKEPANGEFAVVGLVSGERYIKMWKRERGKIHLVSMNKEYPPIEVPAKAVKFAYKIIWTRER